MVDNLNINKKENLTSNTSSFSPSSPSSNFRSQYNHFLWPANNMTVLNDNSQNSTISKQRPAPINWSSNASMKSLFVSGLGPSYLKVSTANRSINMTDTDEEITLCSGNKSSFFLSKSNENLSALDLDRPATARSLPAKVEAEANLHMVNQTLSSQLNRLSGNGARLKNPSCPMISSSQVKLIQVSSSGDKNNEKEDAFIFEQNLTENEIENVDSMTHISNKLEQRQAYEKSNLDKYLEYTMSPFTTKFEIMGNLTVYLKKKFFLHGSFGRNIYKS